MGEPRCWLAQRSVCVSLTQVATYKWTLGHQSSVPIIHSHGWQLDHPSRLSTLWGTCRSTTDSPPIGLRAEQQPQVPDTHSGLSLSLWASTPTAHTPLRGGHPNKVSKNKNQCNESNGREQATEQKDLKYVPLRYSDRKRLVIYIY